MAYTILIADDSEVIRGSLERTIGMTRLPVKHIISVEDGAQALKVLQEQWVDILFTDIHMPNMNGVELITRMHESSDLAQIPAAVISSEASQKRIDQLTALGVCGYIKKPFTPEKIRALILTTLGGWDEAE
ncbi:response regulator [Chitinivibrio alkaliphilus]|uniref:Chemotaxis protein CheY n=1 Tax=Chitinivibrio alkaliphilus ACht1 TaxID=1313304 RepID=U7DBB9_9BACT|nr:response regulator [Chitinivibrio alkaliphilus]ERP31720.1 chemotaxis protein CheY [Chitinivibrio alkaliphilus ACht1]